jgi:hypothetical protein
MPQGTIWTPAELATATPQVFPLAACSRRGPDMIVSLDRELQIIEPMNPIATRGGCRSQTCKDLLPRVSSHGNA